MATGFSQFLRTFCGNFGKDLAGLGEKLLDRRPEPAQIGDRGPGRARVWPKMAGENAGIQPKGFRGSYVLWKFGISLQRSHRFAMMPEPPAREALRSRAIARPKLPNGHSLLASAI